MIHLNKFIIALFVLGAFMNSSKAQINGSHFLEYILENTFNQDVGPYELSYQRKSNNDTLKFEYYVDVFKSYKSIMYAVQLDSTYAEVYCDSVLISVDLVNKKYNTIFKPQKQILAESRYVFRPLLDENFDELILGDSVEISTILSTSDYDIFKIDFIHKHGLQELFYSLKVDNHSKRIIGYSLTSKVYGLSMWESWEIKNILPAEQNLIKHIIKSKYLTYLQMFTPKCENENELQQKENELYSFHISLPTQSLISTKSDTFRFEEFPSDAYLVDYWYRACLPCIKSFPVIKEIDELYDDHKLRIISINNVDKSIDQINEFILKNNISYNIYTSTIETGSKFGNIISYPTFVLYNKDFKIIKIINGYTANLKDDIISALNINK